MNGNQSDQTDSSKTSCYLHAKMYEPNNLDQNIMACRFRPQFEQKPRYRGLRSRGEVNLSELRLYLHPHNNKPEVQASQRIDPVFMDGHKLQVNRRQPN